MQPAVCSLQCAAYSLQYTTCSLQTLRRLKPAACSLQPVALQAVACSLRAACSLQYAICSLQKLERLQLAACSLQPVACNQQPADCSLQTAACSLQRLERLEPAVCSLQIAVCRGWSLEPTACNVQRAACSLHSAAQKTTEFGITALLCATFVPKLAPSSAQANLIQHPMVVPSGEGLVDQGPFRG